MSTIIVQVGQCGNQVGEQLLDKIFTESQSQGCSKEFTKLCHQQFFTTSSNGSKVANAVLIDMESKVVGKCLTDSAKRAWVYNPRACVVAKQGSGNNWANGYYHYGSSMKEPIMDAIRVISDQIAHISTVLLLMSCAGGTGSGLGCKTTEFIREMIPGALVINQVILPFSQGEVSVQVYNTMLTLSTLYQHTDAIVLTHNDEYQRLAKRLLASRAKDGTSFSEMNRLISAHMSGILLPSYQLLLSEIPDNTIRLSTSLDQIIEHVVPQPMYKLLSNRMMPVVSDHSRDFTNNSWEMLSKYSRQMVLQNSIQDEGLIWSIKPRSELTTTNKHVTLNTCLANFVVCRGSRNAVSAAEDKFRVRDMYFRDRDKCIVSYNAAKFDSLDKSVFVMTNAAHNARFLEDLLIDAWCKFNAKAFLYQYEMFGLVDDMFKECFYVMEKVNQDYAGIH